MAVVNSASSGQTELPDFPIHGGQYFALPGCQQTRTTQHKTHRALHRETTTYQSRPWFVTPPKLKT